MSGTAEKNKACENNNTNDNNSLGTYYVPVFYKYCPS